MFKQSKVKFTQIFSVQSCILGVAPLLLQKREISVTCLTLAMMEKKTASAGSSHLPLDSKSIHQILYSSLLESSHQQENYSNHKY